MAANTHAKKKNQPARQKTPVMLLIVTTLSLLLMLSLLFRFIQDRSTTPLLNTKILSTKTTIPKGGPFMPSDGNTFLTINVAITHHLPASHWLAPAVQSYVKDEHNNYYHMSYFPVNDPFKAGPYPPNQKVTGQLTYDVPKNLKKLQWCYNLDDLANRCVPIGF